MATMMDDPVSNLPPTSRGDIRGNHRSRSRGKDDNPENSTEQQKNQRASSAGGREGRSEDEEMQQQQKQKKKKERKSKKKSRGDIKKDKHKKNSPSHDQHEPRHHSSSTVDDNNSPTSNLDPTAGVSKKAEEGVTVSKFLQQQQIMQDQAANRKNASLRRKLLHQQAMAATGSGGDAAAQNQLEAEPTHYFDDDGDSEYDERERGAVVPRNNKLDHSHSSNNTNINPPQVVDTIPADHPSSSIIQKLRTCTLCHRTLPRSQFSERDRFSVNLSIAPGATCRTCSMTVAAVKLKSMPGTEQLLLEYAQRGLQQGMMIMQRSNSNNNDGNNDGNNVHNIAGYLEGGDNNNANNNNAALVLRQNNGGDIVGKELTLYDGTALANGNNNNNNNQHGNIMGMTPKNVNSTFSGRAYGYGDEDRSANVADCKYIDAMLRMSCYLNLNAFGVFQSSADVSVSMAALEAVRIYGTLGKECFLPHDCDGQVVGVASKTKKKKKGGEQPQNREETSANVSDMGGANEKVNPKSVMCIVLNEGSIPRTSILASQHYGWTTLSIDPSLSEEWDGYHEDIPNFTGYSGSMLDYMDNAGEMDPKTMIEFRRQSVRHLVIIGIQKERDTLRLKGDAHINEIRSRYEDAPTTLVSVSPVRKATLAPYQQRSGMCGSKLEKDVGYEPNCSYIDQGVFSECRMVEVWNFHNAGDDDDDEGDSEYQESDDEEEDLYKKDSIDSDYLPKKKMGRKQAKRAAASSRRKKDESFRDSRKLAQQKGSHKEWLEERVAEYKKDKKGGKIDNNDSREGEKKKDEGNLRSSIESIDQKSSHDVVQMPPEDDEGKDSNPFVRTSSEDIENRDVKDLSGDNENHDNDRLTQEEMAEEVEKEDTASPLPDEGVVNDVWEKALAKHGEQQICDQFEEYYSNDNKVDDKGIAKSSPEDDHPSEEGATGQSDVQKGLPSGWEAIHDPASEDYYYNNWETGEVTWDRPPGEYPAIENEDPQSINQDSEPAPMSQLKAGDAGVNAIFDDGPHTDDDDHSASTEDSTPSCDKKPAAVVSDDAPPLVQYDKNSTRNNSRHSQQSDTSENDYVFDDRSSTSSVIGSLTGALTSWYKPSVSGATFPTLGGNNATVEEDDMIIWSDDEASGAGSVDGTDDIGPLRPITRTRSGSSLKKQPWHKNDDDSNSECSSLVYE